MKTVADLAWTAGIIDGEGSIFIMKQGRKDRERGINYILRVSVQSTDPYMTKELLKLFPTGAEFIVQRSHLDNCSDTLKWQINGKRAVTFLKEIKPFLRVKQEQAEAAIYFQENFKKHWRQMTEEDYRNQELYYKKLKDLKLALKIGHFSLEEFI